MQIDTSRVAILADAFGASIKQMRAAEVRALNKTMKWLRTHAVRAVSKEMKVAAKIVRQRIRAFKASRRRRVGRVWAGLQPLGVHRLGTVKKLRRGVRVGRHTFKGAFGVDTGKGKISVFQRTGESKRKMQRGSYTGKMREPIERVDLDIDTDPVRDRLKELFGEAQRRFFEVFRQELKYQVYVKNAR